MLDRFGIDADEVVARARDEASRLSHGHVGTEHLLLGLLGGPPTAASGALVAAGASLASVREKVVEALASRTTGLPPKGAQRELPFSDRANRALDRAGRLSLRQGSDEVHAEHILLSLLTVEGTAGQVLRGLAVDPDAVKAALTSPSDGATDDATDIPAAARPPGEASAPPSCASCGSLLASSLGRATLNAGDGQQIDEVDVFYCTRCGSAIGVRSK